MALPAAGPAQAQTATVSAATGQSCAGTRFGSNLVCTSNDFSSNITFDQPTASALSSCIAGQTITINVLAAITSNSAQRYDGAYFFGETANPPSLNDATKSCSVGMFPTAPDPPFFQQPVTSPDVNVCGDYRTNQSSVLRINGITVRCSPTPGANTVAIPYTLAFSNSNASNCSVATVTAGTTAKCISSASASVTGIVVHSYVKITKQTAPDGSAQPFNFAASTNSSTGIAPSSFSLADNASQIVEVPFNSTGASHTVTITEAAAGGWYPDASIVCTTPSGGSASSYVTVNNAARTIVATLSTANFGAECTITNTKAPTFKLQKRTLGGTGAFSFSSTNLATTPSAITTTAANAAAPSPLSAVTAHTAAAINTAITISETAVPGYRATSAACADSQSAVTGNTGTGFYSLPASSPGTPFPTLSINSTAVKAGAEFNCEITNSKAPLVRIRKVTNGNAAAAGPFTFASSVNLVSTPSLTTSGSGPANGITSAPIEVTALGSAAVITESAVAGYIIASASCTDGNSAASGNPSGVIGSLSGASYTIPAANVVPGADFTCTFTNARTSSVKVQKITQGNSSSAGPFSFTVSNLASAPAAITTSAANVATPASPTALGIVTLGTQVQITEAAVSGYALTSASCTDANSAVTGNTGAIGVLSGATLTIPSSNAVAGADFTCIFTNTSRPRLRVVKISNGGTGSFTFNGGNGYGADTITTLSPGGAGQPGADKVLINASTTTTVTETVPSGWIFSGVSCSGLGSGGGVSTSGSSFTLDPAATAPGSAIICIVTNTAIVTSLVVAKSASTSGPVNVGDVILYAYDITNTGNVPLTGVTVADAANAYGAAPAPGGETLLLDAAPLGDSTDPGGVNGNWTTLGPGDKVRFTWSYTVVQGDIDNLQ